MGYTSHADLSSLPWLILDSYSVYAARSVGTKAKFLQELGFAFLFLRSSQDVSSVQQQKSDQIEIERYDWWCFLNDMLKLQSEFAGY